MAGSVGSRLFDGGIWPDKASGGISAEGIRDALAGAPAAAGRAVTGALRPNLATLGRFFESPTPALAEAASDLVARLPERMRRFIERLPNVGEIGDAVGAGKPAVIDSPEFGESSATPVILEVPVAAEQEGLLEVGKKVHEKFFPGYPPFDFNVNFSCAKASALARESEYADPRSPWFNVFFGRYQIDAPTGEPGEPGKWDRPFGFVEAGSNEICFDDLLRIGKADWGYFSNWMYGVPEADLDRIFAEQENGPKPVCTVTNPAVVINGKEYVECTVEGVKLPSAYVSPEDGKALTNNDTLLSPIWRSVFGKQDEAVAADPALAGVPSFVPTEMKLKFYLRQEKRWDAENQTFTYSTEIYGGGVNKTWAGDSAERQAFNERFLDAQMAAVRDTMPPA